MPKESVTRLRFNYDTWVALILSGLRGIKTGLGCTRTSFCLSYVGFIDQHRGLKREQFYVEGEGVVQDISLWDCDTRKEQDMLLQCPVDRLLCGDRPRAEEGWRWSFYLTELKYRIQRMWSGSCWGPISVAEVKWHLGSTEPSVRKTGRDAPWLSAVMCRVGNWEIIT